MDCPHLSELCFGQIDCNLSSPQGHLHYTHPRWPFLFSQMLQRVKPAMGPGSAGTTREEKKKKKLPKLEDFLNMRDFTGAMTLLEVSRVALMNIYLTKWFWGNKFKFKKGGGNNTDLCYSYQ